MSMRKDTPLSRPLAGITLGRPLTLSLAVVVLGALAPWLVSAYELNLLARFLAMALLAMGLVLVWGQGGVLSLGQGVFFGLGGYAIAMHMKLAALGDGELPDFMVWSGLDALPWWWVPFKSPAVALLGVVLVPGVLAALFSWAVFRRRVGGVYFALITQALALAFATLLISQQPSTGGFNGLTDFQTVMGMDLGTPGAARGLYWLTLALVVAVFLGLRVLMASRYGTLLRAIRDGENRIRFLGYDPTPFKVVAFTIGGALAGLAGALFTLHAGVVSPALVGVVPSIEMVIWVAVGGRNSLAGAIAGTLAVNLAKDGVSSAFPDLWLYALGLVFVLVVTLLPGGLAGLVTDAGGTGLGKRLQSLVVGETK
ncbi:urea ABC transporter permease subunit UrtC [Azospirillum sp. B4]|uniref:urea ABC transporter permease subunit UrtC n=1 Tax=Azospirillum sp. B4 TaxID=95605 RepID=UPI00207909DA|nr:urea ABC transporter permease subunit UrtC [Azospirillum sp. B4]